MAVAFAAPASSAPVPGGSRQGVTAGSAHPKNPIDAATRTARCVPAELVCGQAVVTGASGGPRIRVVSAAPGAARASHPTEGVGLGQGSRKTRLAVEGALSTSVSAFSSRMAPAVPPAPPLSGSSVSGA